MTEVKEEDSGGKHSPILQPVSEELKTTTATATATATATITANVTATNSPSKTTIDKLMEDSTPPPKNQKTTE